MLNPPEFPSNFLKKKEEAPEGAGLPDKLQFSFFVPHETMFANEKVGGLGDSGQGGSGRAVRGTAAAGQAAAWRVAVLLLR